jgi:omega-6 fatty acid desaturase (delta-12 desaturase)
MAYAPVWLAYAAVTGTVWTGMWVIAHECGHGAFSDNKFIQDTVGYILHSLLLVPYFSWQHSHAVHHANTNHITKGETHVPPVVNARPGIENPGGEFVIGLKRALGKHVYPTVHMFINLVFGWPVYLLAGASGGPKYGNSNHFIPAKPFDTELWPGQWPSKVWQSDVGIVGVLGLLAFAASKFGVASVAALYFAPLIFTNCWLVGYTWLQHTDVDVPHLADDEFSYMRGAFLTIDRPYGKVFDYLHHQIGSTHVAHHIDCTIPHYHAREATDAIAKHFPKAYLYDPTPIHEALYRVATNCSAVQRPSHPDGRYTWVPAYAGASSEPQVAWTTGQVRRSIDTR